MLSRERGKDNRAQSGVCSFGSQLSADVQARFQGKAFRLGDSGVAIGSRPGVTANAEQGATKQSATNARETKPTGVSAPGGAAGAASGTSTVSGNVGSGTAELCAEVSHNNEIRLCADGPFYLQAAYSKLVGGEPFGITSTQSAPVIFSAVNAVVLRPLPYKEPEQLMVIGQVSKRYPAQPSISPANYLDWQQQNTVFESMALIDPFDLGNYGRVVLGGNRPAQAQGLQVSASFFDVLGVQPALGRAFTTQEDNSGARVVVLNHDFWRRQFDADPNVLGREIALNDEPYRVIGVMPQEFRYSQGMAVPDIDFWVDGIFPLVARSNALAGSFGRLCA